MFRFFSIKCPKYVNNLLAFWYCPLLFVIIGIWPHALSRYFRVAGVAKTLHIRAVTANSCPYRILTGLLAEPTEF